VTSVYPETKLRRFRSAASITGVQRCTLIRVVDKCYQGVA